MAKIDDIYEGVDDFGLITSSEAAKLGMSNAELVQQAKAGKLVRVARGVYRMPVWPSQPQAPFAIAVKAAASGPSSTESPSSPYSSWHPRTHPRCGSPRRTASGGT